MHKSMIRISRDLDLIPVLHTLEGDRFPLTAGDLRSAYEHDEVVGKALQKELSAGRIKGPFDSPPFANYCCSGLGVVPKQDGSWCIIYHLSVPAGLSLNDGIDSERYTLKYCTVDSAISILNQLGPGTLMAKIDLKHALCNYLVHPSDWELLGIHWKNRYYSLPFGLRAAPYLFNKGSRCYGMNSTLPLQYTLCFALSEDFFVAGPAGPMVCQHALDTMLALCDELGAT